MKKICVALMSVALLQACSNNNGQTGTQNDGTKIGDSNGGAADTLQTTDQSATDTSKMEHRTDISTRDTLDKKRP